MAEYNIDLAVRLAADKALKGLKSLEETADKVAKAVRQVGAQDFNQISRGATGARRQVNNLYAAFQRLDKIGRISAITAATASINQFGQVLADSTVQIDVWGKHVQTGIPVLNQLGSAVKSVTSFIEPLTHFLQGLDASTQAAVAGLGLASAATLAFAPQISELGAKTRQCAETFEAWRKRIFDSVAGLNTSLDVTQAYRNVIRSVTDNIANLSQRQQNAKSALDRFNSTSDEAAAIASTLVSITKRLNNETSNQITLIKNATAAQREFNDQARVRANIAKSSFSRGESGFAAFSQAASRVADENAIEKSIRRQREKLEKAAASAPLMLPSSEMLDAAGRGIQQLSSYYGNLNTQIDTGVRAGQAFTTQLNAQAAKAQGLPPIFGQVEKTLQTVAASTQKGSNIQQSWNTALAQGNKWLREDAVTTSGINDLTKQILDKDYARIEAQKQLGKLKAQEKKEATEIAALQKASSQRAESLALGVGFPLLFGGGPGAVAGGALGSFAGKGFGGQIIFSAIGQQIDAVVASVAELGQALDPLTLNLDAVTKASGISGTELEKYIKQLETSEGKTRAAVEAQRILATVVGDDGVAALQEFGTATRRLSNAFDRAMATMAAGVARLINSVPGFLRFTANLERGAVLQRALSSTDPAQAANLRALQQSRVGRGGVDIAKQQAAINALIATQQKIEAGGGSKQDLAILTRQLNIKKAELEVTKAGNDLTKESVYGARRQVIFQQFLLRLDQINNKTNLTAQAKELETEALRISSRRELLQLDNERAAAFERAAKSGQQQATRAARETERVTREVALLDIRNNMTAQALELDKQISEAKRQKNVEEVATLERSKIQLQALAREEELRLRISNSTELTAKLRENDLRKQGELQKLEQAGADRKQAELDQATKTLSDLDTELALQKAILGGKGEEFQLEQRAIALAKDNKQLSKDKILDTLKQIESVKELVSQQERMKQVFADVGMTIKTGIVDAINAAIYQTQTLAEVANNMLRTISNRLLDVAVNLLLFGVPSGVGKGGLFGGFFADGGQPPMGKVSVVGERGPELFVPHTQGSIIPNDAMGGVQVGSINITVENTGEQLSPAAQKQIANQVQGIVMSTLVNERRSGGVLR